jgi:hypothetical protein
MMDEMQGRMGALDRMSGNNPADSMRKLIEEDPGDMDMTGVHSRVDAAMDKPGFATDLEALLKKYEEGGGKEDVAPELTEAPPAGGPSEEPM